MPCLLCWLRENSQVENEMPIEQSGKPRPGKWLGTELQGEELNRYLEVKANVERQIAEGIRGNNGRILKPYHESG